MTRKVVNGDYLIYILSQWLGQIRLDENPGENTQNYWPIENSKTLYDPVKFLLENNEPVKFSCEILRFLEIFQG